MTFESFSDVLDCLEWEDYTNTQSWIRRQNDGTYKITLKMMDGSYDRFVLPEKEAEK